MTIGLFLLVFVGAKAVAGAGDRKYVDGQRQQYVGTTQDSTLDVPDWETARMASTLPSQPVKTTSYRPSEEPSPPKTEQSDNPLHDAKHLQITRNDINTKFKEAINQTELHQINSAD